MEEEAEANSTPGPLGAVALPEAPTKDPTQEEDLIVPQLSANFIRELVEEKIRQTEEKTKARIRLVEEISEAKIKLVRDEAEEDRAKLAALEKAKRGGPGRERGRPGVTPPQGRGMLEDPPTRSPGRTTGPTRPNPTPVATW